MKKPEWIIKFENGVRKVQNVLSNLDIITRIARGLGAAADAFAKEIFRDNTKKDDTKPE